MAIQLTPSVLGVRPDSGRTSAAALLAKKAPGPELPLDVAGDPNRLLEGWSPGAPKLLTEHTERLNGIEMFWVEAGRRNEKGDNTIVLLHGVPESWFAWRKVLKPLVDAGFHVVAPDLRGFNRTEKPGSLRDVELYTLDHYGADIAALIDRVGRGGPVLLAGHDWGAPVAWTVAAKYPDKVRALQTINGPHPKIWREDLIENPSQEQFQRAWYLEGFSTIPRMMDFYLRVLSTPKKQLQQLMVDDERTRAAAGALSEADLEVYAQQVTRSPENLRRMMMPYQALKLPGNAMASSDYPWLRGALESIAVHLTGTDRWRPFSAPKGDPGSGFDFPKVKVPVGVLFGTGDGFLLPEAQTDPARLGALVAGGDVAITRIDASHWVPEERPDAVIAQLKRLDRVAGGRRLDIREEPSAQILRAEPQPK